MKDIELFRVVYVACGSRNAQTLAATEGGELWAWGDTGYGKIGAKDATGIVTRPVVVKEFGREGIAQLECGTQFSVLLTKTGKVYTWCVCVCGRDMHL